MNIVVKAVVTVNHSIDQDFLDGFGRKPEWNELSALIVGSTVDQLRDFDDGIQNQMLDRCPGLMNSYTQIGVNHLGSKSDENETKSI